LGSAPWTDGDARRPAYPQCPYGAGDHRDAALIAFLFSLLLPPDDPIMKACGPVQLGWGMTPNR
jgi:hypothetical protein